MDHNNSSLHQKIRGTKLINDKGKEILFEMIDSMSTDEQNQLEAAIGKYDNESQNIKRNLGEKIKQAFKHYRTTINTSLSIEDKRKLELAESSHKAETFYLSFLELDK